jgi:hypothetical protein
MKRKYTLVWILLMLGLMYWAECANSECEEHPDACAAYRRRMGR